MSGARPRSDTKDFINAPESTLVSPLDNEEEVPLLDLYHGKTHEL